MEKIAAGEIHLTGLLMLGPHLTEQNHLQVLARAKHRTKEEIARLVRILDPLPDVPAVVEPLGPGRHELVVPMNASWRQWTAALCGPVRELDPGNRPKDWIDADVNLASPAAVMSGAPEASAAARTNVAADAGADSDWHAGTDANLDSLELNSDPGSASASRLDPDPNSEPESSLGPQRYRIQFAARQEYVDLLEEARGLLAHAIPSRSLEGSALECDAFARR